MNKPLNLSPPSIINLLKFFLGFSLAIALILLPFSQFQPSPLESLQTLAVQLDGRKKPLDTVALETVEQIHGARQYETQTGEKLDYLTTYLSLWFNTIDWNQEPFVLLNYRPIKEQLGLNPEQKYFTFPTLMGSPELNTLVRQAHQKQIAEQDLTRDEREALTIEERLDLMYATVGTNYLPLLPHPDDAKGTWDKITSSQPFYSIDKINPILTEFNSLKQAYLSHPNNLATVGELATQLHQDLSQLSPEIYPDEATLKREVHFHHFHPFSKAWLLYILAFVVMLIGGSFQSPVTSHQSPVGKEARGEKKAGSRERRDNSTHYSLFNQYWTSIGIFTVGILIQGYGFMLRMQISGRPPVTNMYESVVWVGFGIAAIALLFELTTRARYYLLAAAPLSVVCLVLADRLPAVLDARIEPLVPVLRDNFWLSVHVPTITLSYASFALALALGHGAMGYYLFAPQAKESINYLSRLNYRVLQLGVLLLTTGIILGGIWAHFSWGRFWGWDPKETWALIALLCYLAPLHGRLVGWIGNFGINVASIVSFNAVLMAWYGVNFVLGTGLHSYGFSTGGSELIIVGIVGADLLFVLATAIRYSANNNEFSKAS